MSLMNKHNNPLPQSFVQADMATRIICQMIWGIFLSYLLLMQSVTLVQASSADIAVSSKDGNVTLTATDADLKDVIMELANATQIHFVYPDSLNKSVTIKQEDISIHDVLRSLLRGMNYAVIYSSVEGISHPVISKVRIFSKVKVSRLSGRAEARILRRIKSYEKRISSLKDKLATPNLNSGRKRSYERRLKRLESLLEKSERKLY